MGKISSGEIDNKVEENTVPLCIMRRRVDGGCVGGREIKKKNHYNSLLCSSNAPSTAEKLLLSHATFHILKGYQVLLSIVTVSV